MSALEERISALRHLRDKASQAVERAVRYDPDSVPRLREELAALDSELQPLYDELSAQQVARGRQATGYGEPDADGQATIALAGQELERVQREVAASVEAAGKRLHEAARAFHSAQVGNGVRAHFDTIIDGRARDLGRMASQAALTGHGS